jgi:hypothetical protein
MSTDQKQHRRSPDFRYFPGDTIGFNFNENGCRIVFGVDEGPGELVEQCGVFMTHKTLKLLGFMIDEAIRNYEAASNIKIEIPEHKVAQIREAMASAGASATEPPSEQS